MFYLDKRIEVTISGLKYAILAEDDAEYTRSIAAYVDSKIKENSNKFSALDSAILTALNIADEYHKEVKATESLRAQIQDFMAASAKSKLELAELRREIARLKSEQK